MTYTLSEYGQMIADKARMDPYAMALKAAVVPDSVVLDLGAGPGIHALLACKFGAQRVYAIEPNEIVHLGRELVRSNGFEERIEFIQGVSTKVTLPETADIIVSDLRGILPLFGQHIEAIVDARQRHLAPGGVLIPKSDRLWMALVEARGIYADIVKPWDMPYGLNFDEARQVALNSWSYDEVDTIRPANLLTDPYHWTTLEYETIKKPGVGCWDRRLEARRAGTAHGWLVWFETELYEGIGFTCGPEEKRPPEVYGRGFFPLLEPVSVGLGDQITLDIEAELVDSVYEWRWRTRITPDGSAGQDGVDFSQATDFDGALAG